MQQYLLTSDQEQARLQLQAQVWEPAAEALFEAVSVQAGWRALDVGCGAMGVLGPLSRRVGSTGRVVGLDPDPALLRAAGAYVSSLPERNVELRPGRLPEDVPTGERFDLVHERFVLPHVPAPEQVIRAMLAQARAGGVIVLQEGDHFSWHYHPRSDAWERLVPILEAAFGLRGDINMGRRIPQLLRAAGVLDIQLRAAVLALPAGHPYLEMPLIALTALRPHIVAAGIGTDEELDAVVAGVRAAAADPERFQVSFTLVQAWGRVPAADDDAR